LIRAALWTSAILIAEACVLALAFGRWWVAPAYLASLWISVLLTWALYLGSMQLIRAKALGTLSRPARVLGAPMVILGFIVLDCLICNVLIGHAIFLTLRHWALTETVSEFKWHRPDAPIRQEAARFICFHFLDQYDTRPDGKGHCRP